MFLLYGKEATVFDFNEYAALLNEIKHIGARTVLEFGPGYSTLAFIEAGCTDICTLEHNPRWFSLAKARLGAFPAVHIKSYRNTEEIQIPELNGKAFDLIFIDSPSGVDQKSHVSFASQDGCSRFNTVAWSLGRAPIVLLHDARRQGEQNTLVRLPKEYGVEMIETRKGIARITRH